MNVADALVDSALRHGSNIAIRVAQTTVNYAELDAMSGRVAGLLANHQLVVGDRVAVMLPNVAQFAALYYGALRAGAVVVPMNPLLKDREVTHYLRDSGAVLIFVLTGTAPEAVAAATRLGVAVISVDPDDTNGWLAGAEPQDEVVVRRPDDTAVILYTSGTTGVPKGAELTHGNLDDNAEICARTLLQTSSEDVILGGLPLFHVFGLTCTLNVAVRTAATLTLMPRFDPVEALHILRRDQVSVFQGVPTMYTSLLNHVDPGVDFPALRVCASGGSAMPMEVLQAFEKRFGCVVLEGYGLSETSPVASFNHPGRRRIPGSIGTPVRGVDMRVLDDNGEPAGQGGVGEIVIRGPNVMKGYWNSPERTAEAITDGWFHTGDLGRVDEQGNFFIVDRKKDLIIRGGYNIYPREIEEVLYEHPEVLEAAVFGVAHPTLGEEVAAAVAIKAGSTATPEDLRDFVRDRVAAYKYPRTVRIVDDLPKGPTGKILKRAINLTGDAANTTCDGPSHNHTAHSKGTPPCRSTNA